MNLKEFRKRVKDRDIKVSSKSHGKLEWSEWYRLAEMTNKIYFGCDFNRSGQCIKLKEDLKTNPNASEMCCCSQCADYLGYLKFIQNKAEVLNEISSLFNPKTGFWRKGSGCSLPRKYRSPTCLGYRCSVSKRHSMTGVKSILITFMTGIINEFNNHEINVLGRAILRIPIYQTGSFL